MSCLCFVSDIYLLAKLLSIKEWAILYVGLFLAALTGCGLPHLVDTVGSVLDIYITVDPNTEEFKAKITPLLLYYCSAAFILGLVAFLQYVCCRVVALKAARRVRRRYFQALTELPEAYFFDRANAKLNAQFEGHVTTLQTALTDHLPNIVTTVAQVLLAFGISCSRSWRLTWPIAILGVVVFLWNLIVSLLVKCTAATESAKGLDAFVALKSSQAFHSWANHLRRLGIRKGALAGVLAGSLYLFLYAGMGIGAIYGNWLIDIGLLQYPGLIFVIACAIVPACTRLGQLHLSIAGFFNGAATCAVLQQVQKLVDSSHTSSLSMESMAPRPTRKQFMTTFLKAEATGYHETLTPRNSPAFVALRRTAYGKWGLYTVGFVLCATFAAAPPTFTKLNGDLYEFYKPNTGPYFDDGVIIGWKYFIFGTAYSIAAIISMIIFSANGEYVAHLLRMKTFQHAIQSDTYGSLEEQGSRWTGLLTGVTNKCKAAFDSRLCQFFVGVFALIMGIGFVFEKNLPSAFFCSICFLIQAMAQFAVSRSSDVFVKRLTAKRNAHVQTLVKAIDDMTDAEVVEQAEELVDRHEYHLSYAFHRQTAGIPTEAARFTVVVAMPQITQAVAYVIGSYLTVEGMVRPIVVYKVVQTLYMSAFSVGTIAQFCTEIHNARIGARDLDRAVPLGELLTDKKKQCQVSAA